MSATITGVVPMAACERGRINIYGGGFSTREPLGPQVRLGPHPVRVVAARVSRLTLLIPPGLPGGTHRLDVEGIEGDSPFIEVGTVVAAGLHQVDNPVVDSEGRLYVTYSGSRGEQVPVSIFRISPDGTRESFVTGLVNATAMAFDPQGRLHVSSRFEGVVYRVDGIGQYEPVVTDVGVACGLAFGPDGTMFVGDRSGTIFRVRSNGQATMMATLPQSVAAFHLTMGPDRALYVSAPTLTSRDHVYRVQLDGQVEIAWTGFGRPQGLNFGPDGMLYVVEALAGASGLYRLTPGRDPELVIAGEGLVGVAFEPAGTVVVSSNERVWRLNRAWA
jgi:sugar lactone lactonase YvrE